jgi:DNA-binding NarL/FixJ family response regulator
MKLTTRQIQVARGIAQDLPPKEIACRLGISRKTVEDHRSNLSKKIGGSSAVLITKFALAVGLVKLEIPSEWKLFRRMGIEAA